MVVNMIKWRPWPPLATKKFEAKILVHGIRELHKNNDDGEKSSANFDGLSKLAVEIKWIGSKANGIRSLKKKRVKKNCTKAEELREDGVVKWDEEFKSVCGFCGSKDKPEGAFLPWEVAFLVFNVSEKRTRTRVPLTTPAVLNLADFAYVEDTKELEINIPLSMLHCNLKCCPSLSISLSLMELRTNQEATQEVSAYVQRSMMFAPLSPCFGVPPTTKKDEGSTFKASLRKVKSLTDFVSSKKAKKAYQGEASSDSKLSTGSDSEYNGSFDTDSFGDSEESSAEESREDDNVQNPCDYGTLVHANLAGGALDLKVNCEHDELIYYSNKQLDIDTSPHQEFGASVPEQVLRQSPKFGILAWRKRKLSFKSPRIKGEPLLKKDYGEEGGDDIDFVRRQLSSDESTAFDESVRSGSLVSEFGDDNFAVGSWEEKEILSRDGSMKLRTQVFFASIDQRSERAAGESACTALVAVIADWLHSNVGDMPIKSEFDSLIREGSLQWRNMCENEAYRERFPDKHLDLDTVLQAKIRPLTVAPERSFIGFFHPKGLEEEHFHFLQESMSFDNIWDEICRTVSEQSDNSEPLVYIVSWNDHFFLLRVDQDAYYIIDTLGERLFEGCTQAYVLKFDRDTTIERVPSQAEDRNNDADVKSPVVEPSSSKETMSNNRLHEETSVLVSPNQGSEVSCLEVPKDGEAVSLVFTGKESCKEYIKSFLAAIPIRELQVDMKKGLMSSTPLHQRLQIEFNYTAQVLPPPVEYTPAVVVADMPAVVIADMSAVVAADVQASMAVDVPAQLAVVHVPAPLAVADVQDSMMTDMATSMVAVAVA